MTTLAPCPTIDIAQLTIKPGRARKEFDKGQLQELMVSIQRHGVIQPIAITKELIEGEEKIIILAGERRFRASLMLAMVDPKFQQIPYRWYEELSEEEKAKIEFDENIRRSNLTEWEKNALYDKIIQLESATRGTMRNDPNAFKLSELALKTGESEATISLRAKFHRDMMARPDIAAKVEGKPMWTQMKEAKRLLEAEAAQAAVTIGKITVSQDYRHGDSRELIKTLPDVSVDMILSDFPFAIPDLKDSQGDAQIYTGLMRNSDNLTPQEVNDLTRELAPHLFRVLKPSSYMAIFFGWECKYFMEYYFRAVGFDVDSEPIIWDKVSTTGSFKGYSPAPCYEQIMWCIKPPREKRMAEPMKKIIQCQPVKKDLRTHVFQKPVELLGKLIKQVTKVGDVVFDPCAGTGSVLAAAMELKRTGIGFELDQDHYALGCKSLHDLGVRLQGGLSGN